MRNNFSFLILEIIFLIMLLCLWACCLHPCFCDTFIQYQSKPEEGIRPSGTGVTDGEAERGCWEFNVGTLVEYPVLLS